MPEYESRLTLFVNGKKFELQESSFDPRWTLLQFLRKNGLTGTKLGCGEGGCGACTVMLSRYDTQTKKPMHYSANACLTPLCSLDGIAVTTVEGIGGVKQGLHPVQRRVAELHGSQCGFCTPGIVMAIYAHLRSHPNATPHEIEAAMDGNLCRCTGYRPILDAARSLSSNKCDVPKGCCGSGSGGCPCFGQQSNADDGNFVHSSSEHVISTKSSAVEECAATNRTEPIFPPFLTHYSSPSLRYSNFGVTWYQPQSLTELTALKAEYPGARLVVGNTEVGIEVKFKGMEYQQMINPVKVPELQELRISSSPSSEQGEGVLVGAAVPVNKLRDYITSLENTFSGDDEYKLRGLIAVRGMLSWFASNHIRNVACIGGNIITASPISDLNPMLLCLGAVLQLRSASSGIRLVPINEFFLSYRKVNIQPEEILENVFIPFTSSADEYVLPFKQARRREDDISIVTSGMRFRLSRLPVSGDRSGSGETQCNDWYVESCSLAFGGMAPTSILAPVTARAMKGMKWNFSSFQQDIFPVLRQELALPANVPGGQAEYRMTLTVSFLMKAFVTIAAQLNSRIENTSNIVTPVLEQKEGSVENLPCKMSKRDLSAAKNFLLQEKSYSRGEQGYIQRSDMAPVDGHLPSATNGAEEEVKAVVAETLPAVGQPEMHKNAAAQVSGETKYCDDMPLPSNALHACMVLSTRPHARLLNVDTTAATTSMGFVAYFSASDVVGSNKIGAVVKDEEVFATEVVKNVGAVIGVVVAETHEYAVAAARKVKVEYEDLPPIISIRDAVAANSFYPDHHELRSGNIDAQKQAADVHVSGSGRLGSQEHFYLETNSTIVLPQENGHMEVYSSTQACTKTQNCCASVCGLPASKVVAKCKRMGGGFGGKETRSVFIACTAALAAYLLDRPVSILVERDVDMSISGQRHAFEFTYKAGCTKDGRLCYMEAQLFSNAGFSLDLSQPVIDRALFHLDNVYKWPALHARGSVCRTNQPSHTAFRGFGGPQGLACCEMIITHLAHAAGLDAETIRVKNLYQDGQRTHFGQTMEEFFVPRIWQQLSDRAQFPDRKMAVQEFNRANRWRKRGICLLPTKFGINFTAKFMNQGGALVHVYVDGTVLVAHGGTEMGQGLYTKVIQVAAQCFGIPTSYIIITETATNTVANSSPTAASMSTDLYGMAVLDACKQIRARLAPLQDRLGGADWRQLINAAFFERIDLSAHGYYAMESERCGFDWSKTTTGLVEDLTMDCLPFNYFTQGVCCTEVEIDCLTGDAQILRADILMDVGKSINPAIDIGQIEGAFMQGFGWSTMEEMIWGDSDHPWVRPGQLFTRGPDTYKIPAFNDVPVDFRVHLSDTHNSFAVHSSKAVGEPPFFLGASGYFAIKEAVIAAREENGLKDDYYSMDLPATSERIRMACGDTIATLCVAGDESEDSMGGSATGIHAASQFHPKGSF